MTQNKLMDLNNHLFEMLERLNDDDSNLEVEAVRAKSVSMVAGRIIENAKLSLDAEKFKTEYGGGAVELPKMISG